MENKKNQNTTTGQNADIHQDAPTPIDLTSFEGTQNQRARLGRVSSGLPSIPEERATSSERRGFSRVRSMPANLASLSTPQNRPEGTDQDSIVLSGISEQSASTAVRRTRLPRIQNTQDRSRSLEAPQIPTASDLSNTSRRVTLARRSSRQQNLASLQLLGVQPTRFAVENQGATAGSTTAGFPENLQIPTASDLSNTYQRVTLARRPSRQQNLASLQSLGIAPIQHSTATPRSTARQNAALGQNNAVRQNTSGSRGRSTNREKKNNQRKSTSL